jgi:TDG/mug DNA glycosylase family protein
MCGAPALVAFTGKRQFLELLNIDAAGQLRKGKAKVVSTAVQLGKQPANMLPSGWPLPVDRTEVWVLTSTSGAAPMSNADRERPYKQLAERLADIPWPRSNLVLKCNR